MFCPKCGAQNPEGAKFCSGCGSPMPRAAPAGPAASAGVPTVAPKSKRPLAVGIAVAAVAVVLLVAFVVVPGLHKNPFEGAKVGDVVKFGSYEQDGNASDGKEPIEWRVLAVEGERAYVVSEKALAYRAFNSYPSTKGNDWDSSDLRAWLAGDFAPEAFSDEEKEYVVGDPTLLSADEVERCFQSDDDRICQPTKQAVLDGVYAFDNGGCDWLLRSPSVYPDGAVRVSQDGDTYTNAGNTITSAFAVRPALWVKL